MRGAAVLVVAALLAAVPAAAQIQPQLQQIQQQVPIQVALTGTVTKLTFAARAPTPVRGAEAYLHPVDATDPNAWIGPSLTDAQGQKIPLVTAVTATAAVSRTRT